jgi:hypothetical protein
MLTLKVHRESVFRLGMCVGKISNILHHIKTPVTPAFMYFAFFMSGFTNNILNTLCLNLKPVLGLKAS